jgi:hypothetical protein
MAEDQGCLGCGCAGCLPLVGAVFLWSIIGTVLVYVVSITAAVLLVGGLALLVGAGLRQAYHKKPATLNCSTPQHQQPQEYLMGNSFAVNPTTTVTTVSPKQDDFLAFTKAFPLRAVFLARDPSSDIRVRILAVDHRWSGTKGDPINVIITFEHLESGHRFHWPAQAFTEHWARDATITTTTTTTTKEY